MADVQSHRRGHAAAVACAVLFAMTMPASADLSPYSQDFEGLVQTDPAALSSDGWSVFGNVFDSGGNFLFGYGVFGAPNGGPGFSSIVNGQGGPEQGAQQLSIYNDYNCCQPSNGHFNGTDLVESNVYQEQVIGGADVGATYAFRFDAKRGNIGGATTAIAFIKTLDPNAGFAVTNFITADTTNLPATWDAYELMLTIDAGFVGQLLEFDFASTASNFDGSGNYYDNISFGNVPVDTDGDGIDDITDNCTDVANPDQRDTNGDGIGNVCDADVTGPGGIDDCSVNFLDLQLVKEAFFSNPASPSWNPDVDFNGNNAVNFADLFIMREQFFSPPGPSGLPNLCDGS